MEFGQVKVTDLDLLNKEATQLLVKGVLDTIKTDTGHLDADLSTIAAEATQLLVKGVLDTIKTDTANIDVALSTIAAEATQLLVKGVLDTIKTDTANLDVALSTVATEATQLLLKGVMDDISAQLPAALTALGNLKVSIQEGNLTVEFTEEQKAKMFENYGDVSVSANSTATLCTVTVPAAKVYQVSIGVFSPAHYEIDYVTLDVGGTTKDKKYVASVQENEIGKFYIMDNSGGGTGVDVKLIAHNGSLLAAHNCSGRLVMKDIT
jgi:hypothetical protein